MISYNDWREGIHRRQCAVFGSHEPLFTADIRERPFSVLRRLEWHVRLLVAGLLWGLIGAMVAMDTEVYIGQDFIEQVGMFLGIAFLLGPCMAWIGGNASWILYWLIVPFVEQLRRGSDHPSPPVEQGIRKPDDHRRHP